eukprot:2947108-Pleurochrysis_carterae.AAC.1
MHQTPMQTPMHQTLIQTPTQTPIQTPMQNGCHTRLKWRTLALVIAQRRKRASSGTHLLRCA